MEPTSDTAATVAATIDDEQIHTLFTTIDDRVTTALPARAIDVWRGRMWAGTEQAIVGHGRIIQPRPRGQTARWFLVGVAAQSTYVSVYVNAIRDGDYLLRAYTGRLGKVKLGPASIAIRDLDHLDLAAFDDLVADAGLLTGPDAW
jgi:hypothetical protein